MSNSVQDGLASDFTSLTKDLYDFHKAEKLDVWKGSPLEQLVVKNFDEEQIWQELELQNSAVLGQFDRTVDEAIDDDALTLLEDSEEEEEGDERGSDGDDQEEEQEEEDDEEDENDDKDEEEEENGLKFKSASEEELDDEDSDIDFDVDGLEKESKQKKEPGAKWQKSRTVSEVDDKFFKLTDMEAFLDHMDKTEGKASAGEQIDYFQDLPSDEEEDGLTFDKPAPSKTKKVKLLYISIHFPVVFTCFMTDLSWSECYDSLRLMGECLVLAPSLDKCKKSWIRMVIWCSRVINVMIRYGDP